MWISVKDRLPDPKDGKWGAYYAIVATEYSVGYAWYREDEVRGKKVNRWHNHGGIQKGVTHWQPLPEPPKE